MRTDPSPSRYPTVPPQHFLHAVAAPHPNTPASLRGAESMQPRTLPMTPTQLEHAPRNPNGHPVNAGRAARKAASALREQA